MKTYYANIVNRGGSHKPECTNCGHRFETDYARNPYGEMCNIACGKYHYCPYCGAKYIGCQIEGVDFHKCSADLREWVMCGVKY